MKYGSAKVQCTCQHEFQDREHGKYQRVASVCHPKAQQNGKTDVRCSVCGRVHQISLEKVR